MSEKRLLVVYKSGISVFIIPVKSSLINTNFKVKGLHHLDCFFDNNLLLLEFDQF